MGVGMEVVATELALKYAGGERTSMLTHQVLPARISFRSILSRVAEEWRRVALPALAATPQG
jgi:hypothetical protein